MKFGIRIFRISLVAVFCVALSACASSLPASDFYGDEKAYYEEMSKHGPEELRRLAGNFVMFGWHPDYEIAIEEISSRFAGAPQWIVAQDINYTGSIFAVRAAYKINTTSNWRVLYYRDGSFQDDGPQIQTGICDSECGIEANIIALADVKSDVSTPFQMHAWPAFVTAFDGAKVIRRAILDPTIFPQAKPTEPENRVPVATPEKEEENKRETLKGPITEIGTVDLLQGVIANWDRENHQRFSEIIAKLESLREKVTLVDELL